jgi:hypothetical protein
LNVNSVINSLRPTREVSSVIKTRDSPSIHLYNRK